MRNDVARLQRALKNAMRQFHGTAAGVRNVVSEAQGDVSNVHPENRDMYDQTQEAFQQAGNAIQRTIFLLSSFFFLLGGIIPSFRSRHILSPLIGMWAR